jgi:hypothetical protein
VSLPRNVHVYAPGVKEDYIPIALTLDRSPAYFPAPPEYPAAKSIRLAAIRETVPAYEGRFPILDTVTLANQQQLAPALDSNRKLTITGQFRYQACDQRTCFAPENVPVRWVVQVDPLDRTRVPEELQRRAGR